MCVESPSDFHPFSKGSLLFSQAGFSRFTTSSYFSSYFAFRAEIETAPKSRRRPRGNRDYPLRSRSKKRPAPKRDCPFPEAPGKPPGSPREAPGKPPGSPRGSPRAPKRDCPFPEVPFRKTGTERKKGKLQRMVWNSGDRKRAQSRSSTPSVSSASLGPGFPNRERASFRSEAFGSRIRQ